MVDARVPLSIQNIPGKGFGCLAKIPLRRGQELLREKPLVESPGKLKLSSPSPEAAEKYFSDLVSNIPADKQSAFYNLSDWRSEQAGVPKQAYRIFISNALPQGRGAEATGAGVYETLCKINHSCLPSCHFSWNSNQREEVVHAVRDIPAGEELSVTYIEPFASRDARRRRLQDRFGFLCACPSCATEGNDLKASNEARERMAALDGQIRGGTNESRALAGCARLSQNTANMVTATLPGKWL